MTSKLLIFFKPALSVLLLSFLLMQACKPGVPGKEETIDEVVENESTVGKLVKIDKVLFSVPSPIQIANMIKSSGANYNKQMLNASKNVTNYTTNFSKSLNLGVYGADLGYVTIYDQTQDAIVYLNVIKTLSDELGISGAFEKSTMERFQNNLGKKDSVLAIITEGFRSSDSYLKNNERKDMGTLIVAGGWVEALYYTTNVAQNNSNQDLINRIGEQRITLENLIKLLMEFQDQKEVGDLIDQLLDLSTVFGGIEFTYLYQAPTVDTANKTTSINSKSQIKISKEQLTQITEKIKIIRNKIVQ